eukprot:scaffold149796_cov24-Tisochrysis_lutea.AAC.1
MDTHHMFHMPYQIAALPWKHMDYAIDGKGKVTFYALITVSNREEREAICKWTCGVISWDVGNWDWLNHAASPISAPHTAGFGCSLVAGNMPS